jgi:hypothetical protein
MIFITHLPQKIIKAELRELELQNMPKCVRTSRFRVHFIAGIFVKCLVRS